MVAGDHDPAFEIRWWWVGPEHHHAEAADDTDQRERGGGGGAEPGVPLPPGGGERGRPQAGRLGRVGQLAQGLPYLGLDIQILRVCDGR